MVQYTAAYWMRTHTLYYPTVHDHEHTPGAVYTHRTEQTPKLRLNAGERRHLWARCSVAQHQALGAGGRWEQSAPTPTWMTWRVMAVYVCTLHAWFLSVTINYY